MLEIDVICRISEHTLYTHTLHMHILHAYAYDYVHTLLVLNRHLTFSLTALRHMSDDIHIINLLCGPLWQLPLVAHLGHYLWLIRPTYKYVACSLITA